MENLGADKYFINSGSNANATSITKRSLQMISYTQRRAALSMAAASCQLHYRMIRIFTIQKELSGNNPTRSSRVFLGIDPGSFRIYFTRHGLSFAFVNAIEIFLATANFSPENYTSSSPLVLHTIYRDPDDLHMSNSNSEKEAGPSLMPNYGDLESDGFVAAANDFISLGSVYRTAKVMDNNSSGPSTIFNIT
ncbi:hypothetical protein FF1_027404 [Malus domestica]